MDARSMVNVLLDQLEEKISRGATSEEIGSSMMDLYHELTGDFRPIIRALPNLAPAIADDLAPILMLGYVVSEKLQNNPEYQAVVSTFNDQRARLRKNVVDAYEKAGFLPEQAFALLLQDIANDMTLARGMSEAARTTKANLQS